jgi:hypothetical protein
MRESLLTGVGLPFLTTLLRYTRVPTSQLGRSHLEGLEAVLFGLDFRRKQSE